MARPRLEAIDVLRGVVMVLMALDHVRDYFGVAGNPTDPARAGAPLFFTRWFTHFCAPVFFLLIGTGASLSLGRTTKPALQRLLLTRGLWLILLELTAFRCLGYQFNFDYRVTMLIVLWALGWAMIFLAALLALPPAAITLIGIAMVAGHNVFDSVRASSFGILAPVWSVLHSPNVILANERHVVFVAYPLIPWVGVTAAGFGLGQIFAWTPERRRAFLLRLGAAMTLGFLLLRASNLYGDPVPWSSQRSAVATALSFLNATKYPPSLLFLLMTLGPALLLLGSLERGTPRVLRPALVLGRVPLFFFLLHIPLIHLIAVGVCYARYAEAHWMFESPQLEQFPFTPPPGWGFPLPVVYLVWAIVVIALYPACRWFAALKQRRRDGWLGYL